MNARPSRNSPLVPLLILGAALVTGVSALLATGANAEGVPTPSETTVATLSTSTVPDAGDAIVSTVTTTPPTGTTPLVAP